MAYRSTRRQGFSLIELLVVVSMIVLLLAIMLPSLAAARDQARTATCGAHLRQVGLAAQSYVQTQKGWIVGSPNTSGNGARPGFGFENGVYTDTYNSDSCRALQVFDWASPLLREIGIPLPQDEKQRYQTTVEGVFYCPSNRRCAGRVDVQPLKSLLPEDCLAPSYASSRYFMYVSTSSQTGEEAGTLWWHDESVPPSYRPRLDQIKWPERKAFLADAHVVSKTRGQIANANWGFTSHGAWRNHEAEPGPTTYRGSFLREEIWRHEKGINILAFDGHVEWQKEGNGRTDDGLGHGARKATWWFPSETLTELLPSRVASREPELLVP